MNIFIVMMFCLGFSLFVVGLFNATPTSLGYESNMALFGIVVMMAAYFEDKISNIEKRVKS